MGRTKLDYRIRTLIENGVKERHRSMFVVIGDKARDQVVILHHILSKATVSSRPSVLWCYKKELGFSSHRKKRMKEIQKKIASGVMHAREDDPFELFISSTQIRYSYYSESHKILGNTFGMLVLQDFEALTPNLLARTVETVEGGGIVVFLLQSLNSLRQLYTLTMDVHNRYRTDAFNEVVARFNERFILSLASCKSCVVMDDRLNVLPISSHILKIEPVLQNAANQKSEKSNELKALQDEMVDTKPIGTLLKRCKTACQAKVLLKLLDVVTDKSLNAICSITAARGRGKSAALGLAIAGAIEFGFTNIFVTSPTPENLFTLFEFVIKGFEAMDYSEHANYEIIKSTDPELNKAVVRINFCREHRQTIQYIHPTDAVKLDQAELLVIDEAAAIPIPLVKKLISGKYLVFLASTINGYEGTGRSLSLKLLEQLRQQAGNLVKSNKQNSAEKNELQFSSSRKLYELSLDESIRYDPDDNIEKWLNNLLCLENVNLRTISGTPAPNKCELYYVNRDTLFSYHKASETFLANLMSIYVAAHYKNTPNDLQMISDAPAHHLFVLMAPVSLEQSNVPRILAVIQVCLEGSLSKKKVVSSLEQGKRAAGDLIPWTISQQFLDSDFPTLNGARIVRLAVHPDFQGMGYGSQAIKFLQSYYSGEYSTFNELPKQSNEDPIKENEDNFALLDEQIEPRSDLPPLLARLSERPVEKLDYFGVSFGLTLNLLKFWKRLAFVPIYIRQGVNDLTGEHTCIMLQSISKDIDNAWLSGYFCEFRHRFIPLLGSCFKEFSPHLALSLITMNSSAIPKTNKQILSREELALLFSNLDLKRFSQYARNMADLFLISDLLPLVANIYFNEKIEIDLDVRQAAILICVGLQRKSVDKVADELGLPPNQTFALLNKAIRRLSEYFDSICKLAIERQLTVNSNPNMAAMVEELQPTLKSLEEDLREAENEIRERQQKDKKKLRKELGGLNKQFAIRGTDEDWADAVGKIDLTHAKGSIISVKSNREIKLPVNSLDEIEKTKTPTRKRKRESKN